MPAFMDLSDGKKHDVRAAQQIDFSADSIVEADIAYLDFNWTREMDEAGVFFVIRGKENIKLLLEEWPLDRENPANKGIQCDWQVESELYSYRQKYTKKLGMVQVCDDDSGNYFE
jgi:hypothetical protein